MKRLAIHKLRDRYFTPIFYTTYNAQFAHDYRLLCFQMYFRTRTGTMEPTKSHKVALINHSAILHLSRSIGVNGHVRNRFCDAALAQEKETNAKLNEKYWEGMRLMSTSLKRNAKKTMSGRSQS